MKNDLHELLGDNPVIAGVKDDKSLEVTLLSDCEIIFILYGNIVNIREIVEKVKDSGKMAFINVDLIEGFSNKEIVIQFLKKNTKVDGILSSKAPMVRAARLNGLYSIHRLFLIDSFSFNNVEKQIEMSQPDCIEVLPGWPKVISWMVEKVNIPIIAAGLVCEKEDVLAALDAGAVAISTTNQEIWSM
ncbi:glycerol-3-phosphate responsive antiterminator [Sebaldella sp. S0638]|uniref:glycerol-3-phosphate responsive antiterminator n=1 Tax=Sebaldella sp. S0638 TaxID=2957809 RepID=UPI00209C80E7|nr:glycerol-3-phosphate responsive antiterminator [Sebaldella sp. S0638]MCP1223630.1 glycerol-3-phosphate responsive antiterminator [Sebaldella sp. S0638]